MNHIKFSEDYEKLPKYWEGTQAVLVSVTNADMRWYKNTLPQFMRYDTQYRGKQGNYPIDFKEGMILVFIHINSGKPFTTIRRFTPRKFDYYAGEMGNTFVLEKL